jgi:8-oxo-dGTP pyrophosphatase MutT (NUDIX family)
LIRPPINAHPESWPIEPAGADLPAVPAARLTADELRLRFAQMQTLAWTPEVHDVATQGSATDASISLRPAAVLIALVQRSTGPTVLLTRRTAHLHHHAGQISFPGGRREPDDADAVACALREAAEEVGLDAGCAEVLGVLPDYQTGTGFRITPVVALIHEPFSVRANAFEVAEIFEVPLVHLMNPAHHQVRVFRAEDGSVARRFFAMPWSACAQASSAAVQHGYFIWGATAAMLRNLYRFLSA